MKGRRPGKKTIVARYTGEFPVSEIVLKILKHMAENRERGIVRDENGRKRQRRDLREDKQG